MVTDNQAKEAIKTIAEYCKQFEGALCYDACILRPICDIKELDAPENWPEYLD